jgi:hypothetical protein
MARSIMGVRIFFISGDLEAAKIGFFFRVEGLWASVGKNCMKWSSYCMKRRD